MITQPTQTRLTCPRSVPANSRHAAQDQQFRLELVARVRESARSALPPGANVLVVSRGDDQLVDLGAAQGAHFPADDSGVWLGYHPADGSEAVRRLKAVTQRGANYLVLPCSSFWWLDHYRELRSYLGDHADIAWKDSWCVVYRLRRHPEGTPVRCSDQAVRPTPAAPSAKGTRISFMSNHCARGFVGGRLSVAIEKETSSKGVEVDEVYFEVPADFHAHNDCVATALMTLAGRRFESVQFNFSISNRCAAVLQRCFSLKDVGPVDAALTPRRPGRGTALNFSGGFDSLAAYVLVKDRVKLIACDFGGWFAREAKFFQTFRPHVSCRTNIRENYGRNHWAFMGSASILFADYLDVGQIAFGGTLEATAANLAKAANADLAMPGLQLFNAAGLEEIYIIRGITQHGTALLIARGSPELAANSLESLAASPSEKRLRKKLMMTCAYEYLGQPLPRGVEAVVAQAKPVAFGSSLPVDMAWVYFAKRFGVEFCTQAVPGIERHDWSVLKDLSLNFYWKYNTNFTHLLPANLRDAVLVGMHSAGVYPYNERDWYEYDVVRSLVLRAEQDHALAQADARMPGVVEAAIPPGGRVAILSRGDGSLLNLGSRQASHFPSNEDGAYPGCDPADSAEAIRQLDAARGRGLEYLIIPRPSFSWLDRYTGFREHLMRSHERICDDVSCFIFRLARSSEGRTREAVVALGAPGGLTGLQAEEGKIMAQSGQHMESAFGRCWDSYLRNTWPKIKDAGGARLEWPGDEWGSEHSWSQLYAQLFSPFGVAAWQRAVEIGPGSGKYTIKVLSDSDCQVRAYDVSAEFLKVCQTRCQDWIDGGRLSLELLGVSRPDQMLSDLDARGWRRKVDAFFSIDAMVHVDLQYLVVYLITAALTLRPGGKLILTLADATRDAGFAKLLRDIRWTYRAQNTGHGSGKFEWLSPDIVRSVLPRLGFELDMVLDTQRDLRVVATLSNPSTADELEARIRAETSDAA